MRNRSFSSNTMTNAETVFGWLYLPMYFAFLPTLVRLLFQVLHLEPTLFEINLVYYGINLAAVSIGFHRFLSQRFFGGRFWNFVQAHILGAVMHYVGKWLVGYAVDFLGMYLPMYNNDTITSLVLSNPYVMLFVSIILAPIVEETLFRGVVFGSLRRTSRIAAYIVSVLLFALLHTWQFFSTQSPLAVVLSTLPYLPAGIALAWTYDRADTIWAPITLHALINAVSYGLVSFS